MADPVSMMVVGSLVSTAAGSVIGGMGAASQGRSMSAMAQYQAAVARNNQIIAERNADYASESGQRRGEAVGMKTAQTIGAQKAGYAASGIDVNSGSPLDVRVSTAELGKLDTLTVLNEAANKAAGFRAQASNFAAEEGLDLMKASNYETEAKWKVASSLVGGASSFSDKWLGYQSKGLVPNVWGG